MLQARGNDEVADATERLVSDRAVESASPATASQALEGLMRQALAVPGAAAALLEAFALQSRTLRLVQEADARGAASLPVELRQRLTLAAATTPSWLMLGEGLRA